MNIFVTSDSHYGHSNIIQHCNRGFSDVHEMNSVLTENWNSVVKPGDLVYHLGDFAFHSKSSNYRDRLNGKIVLIRGNHDKQVEKYCFSEILDYHVLKMNGFHYILFHYPIASWHGKYRGYVHLHGHCHGNYKDPVNSIDVGVDSNNFTPIPIESIKVCPATFVVNSLDKGLERLEM